MNLEQEYLQAVTRRHFYGQGGVGLGAMAFAALLQRGGVAVPQTARAANPVAPKQQNNAPNQLYIGRDHHPFAFTMLLAGGGIKGGQTYGQTDDIGYYITENQMDVRDLQATILHLLGFDPFKLTYNFQGLDQRLIGAEGKAKLHPPLLA